MRPRFLMHLGLLVLPLLTAAPASAATGSALAAPTTPVSLPLMLAAETSGDHGEGDYAGEKEEPSLFASEPWPYIWNLIMFLVLLAVLTKFVWPPILKGLQAREDKQLSDLAQAKQANEEATAKLAEYEAKLKEAHREAGKIMEQTRAEADKLSARLKAEAEANAKSIGERAEQDISAAKTEALASIYSQAATLSTQIAGQILKRELNPEDQAQLVEQSLAQINSTNN